MQCLHDCGEATMVINENETHSRIVWQETEFWQGGWVGLEKICKHASECG